MGTTRRLSLIIGVVLVVAAIVGIQTFRSSPGATPTSQPYTGMGDFRRFEVQQEEAPATAGMGDLRQLEAQAPIIPVTGGSGSSLPIAGMGDFRRLEVQQQSSMGNAGMGDLRRFEGEQVMPQSSAPQDNTVPVTFESLVRSIHSDKIGMVSSTASKGPGR